MTVIWNFATTQTIPFGPSPQSSNTLTGTLTLSDAIWSSGGLDYAYTGPAYLTNPGHPIPALDWALTFDGYDDLSFPQSLIDFGGTVHLSFAGGTLSGRITQTGYFSDIDMYISNDAATGSWGTDYFINCCAFVGVWVDPPSPSYAAVPEPTLGVLALCAAVLIARIRRARDDK